QEILNDDSPMNRMFNLNQYIELFQNVDDVRESDSVRNALYNWTIYKKLMVFAYLSAYLSKKYSNADNQDTDKVITVECAANLVNEFSIIYPSSIFSNYPLISIQRTGAKYTVITMNASTGRKRKRELELSWWNPVYDSAIYPYRVSYNFLSPAPRHYDEEKAIGYYIFLDLIKYYMVPTMQRWKNIIRQILAIIDVLQNFDFELDSSNDIQSENFYYNPANHLSSYSHRTVSVPIMADLLGIELEYDGDVGKISNFGKEFEYLRENGWVLERDGSVTLELKSPIITLDEINSVSKKCRNLFDAWSANTNKNTSGMHIHVSMDREFSVGKQPASKTSIFLTRLAQEIESNLFQTASQREKIFKRNFNSYTRSSIGVDHLNGSRYYWLNLEPLYRDYGKTIEVRLGSAALANEINIYAEKAYMIVKLIKFALKSWRNGGRQDYTVWRASLNGKLLKALLPKDDLKRFIELFK
ncbi:MAG: amidoligase family protein, partial [Conexivisphaerales archaeon]